MRANTPSIDEFSEIKGENKMEISTVGLIYKDPPVTKRDLIKAQQAVEPVNFPSYKAEISDKAKALAVKISEIVAKDVKDGSSESDKK